MQHLLTLALVLVLFVGCGQAPEPAAEKEQLQAVSTEDSEFVCPIGASTAEEIQKLCLTPQVFSVCGEPDTVEALAAEAGFKISQAADKLGTTDIEMTFRQAAQLAEKLAARLADKPGHEKCDGPEPANLPPQSALTCENKHLDIQSQAPAEIPGWLLQGELGASAADIGARLPAVTRDACGDNSNEIGCAILGEIDGFDPAARFSTKDEAHSDFIPQRSIFASLPAADETDETVLLTAHLDTTANSPGVEDNLSGVILLLTVMNTIVEHDLEFPWNLQFAFYAGEEYGRIGSRLHRQLLADDDMLHTIRAVMNFDMIARDDHSDGTIRVATQGGESYDWISLDVAGIVAQHMAEALVVKPLTPAPTSDNITWQSACRPVAAFRKLQNLADVQSWYHQPEDTKTEYSEIDKLAQATLIILMEWS